ncbi:Fic family protein [Poseidonibacter lekithochrous]|uniref:Fic family protein n=1 Tax=Poseidonibacter TaxID=2321187 RepID=UPI001C095970|nr:MULTISPECIES: Fic family protein [Poseidonibacter]MBU3015260.1 Fic family protein [Poseidonibacter lekithochrous]MDO6828558.1 Fic family protein [Poseidonibacter sp. 1_MG-2023]
MYTTLIIPKTEHYPLNQEILNKAERIIIESAKLTGNLNIQVINAIKDNLRTINSYYSNKIESEGTHPIDIERAMKNDFSQNDKTKSMQQLSLVHIEVQKYLESTLDISRPSYSLDKILEIHEEFYKKKEMNYALNIKNGELEVKMIPGKLREGYVQVGVHIPPKSDELKSCFNEFENLYNQSSHSTHTMKLIYALCSHHRLTYIHPFYDGNGRISRLYLDYLLFHTNIQGYGLWNISRGLARNQEDYRKFLAKADDQFGPYNDGRGPLTLKGLETFLEFMLDIALDQVLFMSQYLKLDSMVTKIKAFVELSQKGMLHNIKPLPKNSNKLLEYLLIHGEVTRGEAIKVLDVSAPTSNTIVKELLEEDYLETDSPRGKLKFKLNSKLSGYLIPDLFEK